MISRDTARMITVGYGLKQGTMPEIRQIWVYDGTQKFTSPDTEDIAFTLTVYDASADADGDGFPDPGATPLLTIPGVTASGKRVTLP